MIIFSEGITHNGIFHADDVFSTALLKIVNPSFSVKRLADIPETTDDLLIYDIGGGKYDHHGSNIKYHDNGRRYASFGLLWNEYGEYISGSNVVAKRIEENFVSVIDESDNGGEYDMISRAVSAFNPTWNSKEGSNEAFDEAVQFAFNVLSKVIRKERSLLEAETEIHHRINEMQNGIVTFSYYMPFSEELIKSDAVYVIYPSERGGFCVQGVPVCYESRIVKKPFPKEWRGKNRELLFALSGIKELNFCHNTGFLAVTDTFDSALKVAEYSLET